MRILVVTSKHLVHRSSDSCKIIIHNENKHKPWHFEGFLHCFLHWITHSFLSNFIWQNCLQGYNSQSIIVVLDMHNVFHCSFDGDCWFQFHRKYYIYAIILIFIYQNTNFMNVLKIYTCVLYQPTNFPKRMFT
jgi:hypothetical protein